MDAILIIEDQLKMVEILQRYLGSLNKGITTDTVHCFTDKMQIKTLTEALMHFEENKRVNFRGRQDAVVTKMLDFLRNHKNDRVFVMVDVLLNSLDASQPTPEKYKQDREYSDKIYLELLKAMYKDDVQLADPEKYHDIDPDNFDFTLYSRSSASRSLISLMLTESYDKNEKRKEFMGLNRDFFSVPNIFWCKNRCERTGQSAQPVEENPALDLPTTYTDYIKEDLFQPVR